MFQQFKVPPISKRLYPTSVQQYTAILSFPEEVQFSARPSCSVLLSGGGNKRLLFCLPGTKEKCIPREHARPAADNYRCPTTLAVTHGCARHFISTAPSGLPPDNTTCRRRGKRHLYVFRGSIPDLASAHCLHGVHSTPRVYFVHLRSQIRCPMVGSLLTGASLRNGFVR